MMKRSHTFLMLSAAMLTSLLLCAPLQAQILRKIAEAVANATTQNTASTNVAGTNAAAARTSRPATAKTVAAAPETTSGRFNYFNPFAPENYVTDGTPWQKAEVEPIALPEGISVILPDPLPDVCDLSLEDYQQAVSFAVENLHIIYGEQTEEDAEAFLNMWAPIYDSPCQEFVDYLNKLNPLLSQFVYCQQSYYESYRNALLLLMDAAEAADWEDLEAYKLIMSEAELHTYAMQAHQAAMTEIANRIQILGNPPDPFEMLRRNREVHDRIFQRTKQTLFPGETWLGTRESTQFYAPGLSPLTELLPRYLFAANVDGKKQYFVLQLIENRPLSMAPTNESLKSDPNDIESIRVEQIGKGSVSVPNFKSDGVFQPYYPTPPVGTITALALKYQMQTDMSDPSSEDKKDPELYAAKLAYHNAAGNLGHRLSMSGMFFSTALRWGMDSKWDQYTYKNGVIPEKALHEFEEAVKTAWADYLEIQRLPRKERQAALKAQQDSLPVAMTEEQLRNKEIQDSLARDRQSIENAIQTSEEQIASLQSEVDFQMARKREKESQLAFASGDEEKALYEAIDQIDKSITNTQALIDNLQSSIKSMESGSFHYKRSKKDKENLAKTIASCNKDKQDDIFCRTMATSLLNKQIAFMPEEMQEDARARMKKVLWEEGALSAKDADKIKQLARTFNGLMQGNELREQSEAEYEAAVWEAKEYGALAVELSCGVLLCGEGAHAMAKAGVSATQILIGTKLIGGVYAGATGYVKGGPSEAVKGAVRVISPATSALTAFVEGYLEPSKSLMTFVDSEYSNLSFENATVEECWNAGLANAYGDLIISGVMDLGINIIAKSASMVSKHVRTRFTPVNKTKLEMLRTQRQRLEAQDGVKAFERMSNEYQAMMAANEKVAGTYPKNVLDDKFNEMKKYAAALNSDWHAKWHIKYKTNPTLREDFNEAVKANYDKVIPMVSNDMQAAGYDMSKIDFKPIRNSSSAGSSSMDLDLMPVKRGTGTDKVKAVEYEFKSDAETYDFMVKAQKSLDAHYYKEFGYTSKSSELNLTTKLHPEAYSNKELLKEEIDFSKVTKDDVASIGKVLAVKKNTIEGNVRMTKLTQQQAKAREGYKEIDNMCIKVLENDAQNAATAEEKQQIMEEVIHWKDMSYLLKEMGTGSSNPARIQQIEKMIKFKSGGKTSDQVLDELIHRFNPSYQIPATL